MRRFSVRERVPRKQGLKPYMPLCRLSRPSEVRERVPRKQGLKLKCPCYTLFGRIIVRERVPRKQGLKRYPCNQTTAHDLSPRASSTKTRIETNPDHRVLPRDALVRERVPRKQGLKLSYSSGTNYPSHSPRASSTKTRIETQAIRLVSTGPSTSESEFHENKD